MCKGFSMGSIGHCLSHTHRLLGARKGAIEGEEQADIESAEHPV